MATDIEIKCDELDKFLNNADKKLEKAVNEIIENMAKNTLNAMTRNYRKAEHQAGEMMIFSKEGNEKEQVVSMSGPQAWYSEFGTGTRGELKPHPYKGKYALKPYNSGRTIRVASEKVSQKDGAKKADIKQGDLYWTYIGEDGKVYYSKGIPAQKIVYDAGQLAKRRLNPTIKKYMKGMFE